MPARVSAQHAGAGRAGAAQPLPPGFLLLLQALLQKQPAQEDEVSHKTGEREGPGRRPYASTVTCFANVKVGKRSLILNRLSAYILCDVY